MYFVIFAKCHNFFFSIFPFCCIYSEQKQNQSSLITFYYTNHFSHRLKALSCCSAKYNAFYHLNCHMCTPFIVKCDGAVYVCLCNWMVGSCFGSLCQFSLWLLCFCSNEFIIFVASLNPTIICQNEIENENENETNDEECKRALKMNQTKRSAKSENSWKEKRKLFQHKEMLLLSRMHCTYYVCGCVYLCMCVRDRVNEREWEWE